MGEMFLRAGKEGCKSGYMYETLLAVCSESCPLQKLKSKAGLGAENATS